LYAGLWFVDFGDKPLHFQNMLRAEFHADAAAFAIFFNYLDSGRTHGFKFLLDIVVGRFAEGAFLKDKLSLNYLQANAGGKTQKPESG
jgi:hypothetical protein